MSATAVAVAILVTSGASYPWPLYVGHFPDVVSDKYTALAALDGSGPYATLDELAHRYGFAEAGWPAPHPRPPAALLVQLPLVLIPDPAILWVAVAATLAKTVSLFWASARVAGVDTRLGAAALLVFMALPPFRASILYAVVTPVPWAIVFGWLLLRLRPGWAGALFGFAAAVKLWPAIIVAALLFRRDTRRVALIGVVTATALTGAGLLLPGVSISGTVEALRTAGAVFGVTEGSISLYAAIGGWAVLVGGAVFAWAVAGGPDRRIGGAVVAGLLMSPIVWAGYWLSALPGAFLLYRRVLDRSETWGSATVQDARS